MKYKTIGDIKNLKNRQYLEEWRKHNRTVLTQSSLKQYVYGIKKYIVDLDFDFMTINKDQLASLCIAKKDIVFLKNFVVSLATLGYDNCKGRMSKDLLWFIVNE